MATEATQRRTKCINCGFEAPSDSSEWKTVQLPKLGSLTQCPNCESTNTMTRR